MIRNGANISAASNNGTAPLHVAANNGNILSVEGIYSVKTVTLDCTLTVTISRKVTIVFNVKTKALQTTLQNI